jgi:FixJ family two-component response regulator
VTKPHLLIAVVDDEEPVRKALMRLMRSAGLRVEMFGSGTEFLKSLETRMPDSSEVQREVCIRTAATR